MTPLCKVHILSRVSEKKREERKRGVAKEGKDKESWGWGSKGSPDHAKSYIFVSSFNPWVFTYLSVYHLSTHPFILPWRYKG